MSVLEDQIRELEDELQRTPYNKATSKHIGRIKAKIARLRDEAVARAMKAGGGGEGLSVKKSGDATAVLVGFPSTGKSTLLNKLPGRRVLWLHTILLLSPLCPVLLSTRGQRSRSLISLA